MRLIYLFPGFLIMTPVTAFIASGVQSKMMIAHVFQAPSFERCQKWCISEKEDKTGIDKVVKALQKDNLANQELGRLVSVNKVWVMVVQNQVYSLFTSMRCSRRMEWVDL